MGGSWLCTFPPKSYFFSPHCVLGACSHSDMTPQPAPAPAPAPLCCLRNVLEHYSNLQGRKEYGWHLVALKRCSNCHFFKTYQSNYPKTSLKQSSLVRWQENGTCEGWMEREVALTMGYGRTGQENVDQTFKKAALTCSDCTSPPKRLEQTRSVKSLLWTGKIPKQNDDSMAPPKSAPIGKQRQRKTNFCAYPKSWSTMLGDVFLLWSMTMHTVHVLSWSATPLSFTGPFYHPSAYQQEMSTPKGYFRSPLWPVFSRIHNDTYGKQARWTKSIHPIFVPQKFKQFTIQRRFEIGDF